MGLGLGSFPTIPKIGHKIFPVTETKPLRRVREYVKIVRLLWSGEKVTFKGEVFSVEDIQLGLKPENEIPLYLASLSPKIQSFAGANADGVILSPALTTVESTLQMVSSVKDGEQTGNRTVDKASYMLTSVDESHDAAVDTMKGFYFFLYQLAEVVRPEVLEDETTACTAAENTLEGARDREVTDIRFRVMMPVLLTSLQQAVIRACGA